MKDTTRERVTWIQTVTLGFVCLSWLIVPWLTERYRKEAEVGIWQHTAMSDAHRNLATALHEIEQYTRESKLKHKCRFDDLTTKMTDEELNKANQLMSKVNTELEIMYMIMPDDLYEVIQDSIPIEQPTKLTVQRKKLLAAMRKSQFPDTRFSEPKNIRTFDLFERPDKQVKNQQ